MIVCVRGNKLVLQEEEGKLCWQELFVEIILEIGGCLFERKQEVSTEPSQEKSLLATISLSLSLPQIHAK